MYEDTLVAASFDAARHANQTNRGHVAACAAQAGTERAIERAVHAATGLDVVVNAWPDVLRVRLRDTGARAELRAPLTFADVVEATRGLVTP